MADVAQWLKSAPAGLTFSAKKERHCPTPVAQASTNPCMTHTSNTTIRSLGTPVRLTATVGGTISIGDGARIIVDDRAWVGFGALILSGVHIGRGSVVAAGAVVNEKVPVDVLVAGNPAEIVEDLPPSR